MPHPGLEKRAFRTVVVRQQDPLGLLHASLGVLQHRHTVNIGCKRSRNQFSAHTCLLRKRWVTRAVRRWATRLVKRPQTTT